MADMKHSLEEMSMTSVCEGMDTVSSTQGDELKLEKGGIAVGSNQMVIVKQDFQTQNLQKNKLQNSEKLSEREHGVMPIHHPQKSNDIDIPKILSIPKGKEPSANTKEVSAFRVNQLGMLKSTEESSSTTPFKPKEVDFVLQCPLFPEQLETMPEASQEFQNLVESFGLRFLPTVNTVLSKTRPDLSNFFLQRWREKMIKELGEVGFKKHQEGERIFTMALTSS